MSIRIVHFAQMRELCGCSDEILDYSSTMSIRTIWDSMILAHPKLRSLSFVPLPVVNRRYESWDRPVPDGAEVSFFPPLGGG